MWWQFDDERRLDRLFDAVKLGKSWPSNDVRRKLLWEVAQKNWGDFCGTVGDTKKQYIAIYRYDDWGDLVHIAQDAFYEHCKLRENSRRLKKKARCRVVVKSLKVPEKMTLYRLLPGPGFDPGDRASLDRPYETFEAAKAAAEQLLAPLN